LLIFLSSRFGARELAASTVGFNRSNSQPLHDMLAASEISADHDEPTSCRKPADQLDERPARRRVPF